MMFETLYSDDEKIEYYRRQLGIEEAENEREIFKVGFRNSRVCFDTTILCNNGLFAE